MNAANPQPNFHFKAIGLKICKCAAGSALFALLAISAVAHAQTASGAAEANGTTGATGTMGVTGTTGINGTAGAIGAAGTTGIDATGNSQSELAACNNGTTQQSRQTCITEAENARAAKRAGKLGNSGSQFDANALQRCNVLQGEDKIACEARVRGYGTSSGSVAGGGTLREVETVVMPPNATEFKVQPKTNSDIIIVVPAPTK